MTLRTPGSVLLAAQQSNLSHDERMATMVLRSLEQGIEGLSVREAITRAEVTLTIEGASKLEIDLEDPNWLVERSGILDPDGNGILNTLGVSVDTVPFRLADVRRDPGGEIVTLEFQDLAMALLEEHSTFKAASRGSRTRAQFVEMLVDEIKARDLVFWSPESVEPQPVAKPDFPDARPSSGSTGFDQGTTFKIQGQTADAGQMREVATALGVADQEDAPELARLAELCGGIGESGFRDIPNAAGSPYGGVFQALKTRHLSTEEQARHFLKGGAGFQGGGAIALARSHPDWSPGKIALTVEGSRSNFASEAAAEHFYEVSHPGARPAYNAHAEAKVILGLWNSGNGASGDQVLRFKQYRFTRGLPGKRETSREAITRLASEVNWRFYAIGGVVAFVTDDHLMTFPAGLVLEPTIDARDGSLSPPAGLLRMPGYEHFHGKLPSEVELHAVANAWSIFPGEVVALRDMGQITGRWIVEEFTFNLLDATVAVTKLIKPIPKRKEPAPEATTVTSDEALLGGSGTGSDGGWAPTIAAGANRPGAGLNDPVKTFLALVGRRLGKRVIVTTGTNHSRLTITGNVSDHANGDAADMGTAANGVRACDEICYQALRLCGLDADRARELSNNGIGEAGVSLSWRNYRVQVFWKSNDPGIGNHYDHVHVGVAPR